MTAGSVKFKIDEGRVLFPLIVEQTLVSCDASSEFNVLARVFRRPTDVTVATWSYVIARKKKSATATLGFFAFQGTDISPDNKRRE